MYFLKRGKVTIKVSDDKSILLKKGAFFGEIALFNKCKRTADIKAETFCILLVLTRDSFISLTEEYIELSELFKEGLNYKYIYKQQTINLLNK